MKKNRKINNLLKNHAKKYSDVGLVDNPELVARYFFLDNFHELIRIDGNELKELSKTRIANYFLEQVRVALLSIVTNAIKNRKANSEDEALDEEASINDSDLPLFSLSLKTGVERFYNNDASVPKKYD